MQQMFQRIPSVQRYSQQATSRPMLSLSNQDGSLRSEVEDLKEALLKFMGHVESQLDSLKECRQESVNGAHKDGSNSSEEAPLYEHIIAKDLVDFHLKMKFAIDSIGGSLKKWRYFHH